MKMAKDDFETFMHRWTREHISPTDACGDADDVLYAATLRSDHLTLLAAQTGFYKPLREKAKPYGGVVPYIMSLFDEATLMTRCHSVSPQATC
jgi:hypothetical protein